MARRYNRDSKGRFARAGGPGSISNRPVVFSAAAADTRTAGMIQRGNPRATFRATRAGEEAKYSPKGAARRMARTYRQDPEGLRADLKISRREARQELAFEIADARKTGSTHPVDRALSRKKSGRIDERKLRQIIARGQLKARSTDAF